MNTNSFGYSTTSTFLSGLLWEPSLSPVAFTSTLSSNTLIQGELREIHTKMDISIKYIGCASACVTFANS